MQVSSRLILRLSRLKFALWGREVGGLRLPGGQGAGARCDVDRWFPAARVLASGEDRLVPTSSRLILRLSRLTFALSGREVGGLRQPARAVGGQGRTGGDRRRLLTVFFPCARDRRGPACTDLLPADSSTFPTYVAPLP